MSRFKQLLQEIIRDDPRILLTHGHAIAEGWRHAALTYEGENPRIHPNKFSNAMAYDVYLRKYHEEMIEYQTNKLRDQYRAIKKSREETK